jgi:O-Antigen ligase
MNRPMNLLVAAVALVFFTSSFDIFLVLSIGPNIRIAQLFTLVLLAAALITHKLGMTMEIPLGAPYLIAWLGVQLAFVPVAEFWQKSMGYCVWLALNIGLAFAMVNLFSGNFVRLQTILKLYLGSFVFVGCFGILQFVLPVAGGPGILVEQWWLPGRVPRVNGFSYEPSYFATYLIMGLVSLGSLRRSKESEFRTWTWTLAYLLLILAMILCSSRMGLAFVLIELAIAPLIRIGRIIRNPRLVLGFHVSGLKILAAAMLIWIAYAGIGGAVRWFRDNQETAAFLLKGTGLLGTAAHSVNEREDRLDGTLQTISDHPWMGQSLGGISESIAGYFGLKPQNFEEAKVFEGQSVFAEVLASSGLPGSIPFFCFLVVSIVAPWRLARRTSSLNAAWLRALVQALVFEWAILQFNATILRLYLWVHIAVLATLYAAVRRQCTEPADSAPLARISHRSTKIVAPVSRPAVLRASWSSEASPDLEFRAAPPAVGNAG